MSTVLKSVALSANPNAKVVDSADGLKGKANMTSNNREYVVLVIESDDNAFKIQRAVRTYTKSDSGKWPGLSPDQIQQKLEGKDISNLCVFMTMNVEPYDIEGRTVTTYTTAVFKHENPETVFRNAGHPIMGTAVTAPAAVEVASAE